MPASISLPFFLHLRQPPPSSLPATMRPHSSRRSERSYGCAELCCLGYTCLQLFWARVVLRKWLNISAKESDFSADTDNEEEDIEEDDDDNVDEFLDAAEELPRPRRRNSETFRAQYINTKDIRICVGTWNVGGRLPPDDLDIEEWLDISKPADIYVLGLQEIVPLNAGNIFGPEDSRPVLRWENIIRETLNRVHPTKRKYKSYSDPPSPSKFKPSEDVPDVVDEILLETDSASEEDEVHPVDEEPSRFYEVRDRTVTTENRTTVSELSTGDGHATMDTLGELETQTQFSSPRRLDRLQCFSSGPRDEDNISVAKAVAKLSKTLSGTERIGLSWPEPPLNLLGQHVLEKPKSFQSTKSYKLGRYSSFKSTTNEDRKDLSDIAMLAELDLELLIRRRRRPEYIRIVSKQMIGIFLTIWVRRSLRKHIQNLKVSTVGVGVMGYIGNKGSISVSMSVYQTLFCFICTHLTSGEKEGDELKRNDDVHEIQRRTLFRPESTLSLPKSIHDHEKIIWLGDLNYRINLSYGETRDLISKKQWSKLVERDQLVRELKKGRAFDGWSEGTLNFPPTYKYELNSEKYYGEDPKAGRRTPAWCDRILSFGKGIRLLNYKRSELKLSDHRPVTAAYMVEVEVFSPKKLQRALTFTNAEIENEDIKLGK